MLQFDTCHLKLGNYGIQIAALPDSIHISPEYPYEMQDDSGIAIRESLRHILKKIFPDINGHFHEPEHLCIIGYQKGQY